jgi:hypothetical protein
MRKRSGSRKRKSNPLKQFKSRGNMQGKSGSELVAQAMKNGIIVRLDPLEYPIFMKPGAFVMETKDGKKIGGFDVSVFMRQNDLTKRPNKRTVTAEMKKGLENMTLTYYLLNSKQFLEFDNNQEFMGTTKQQAAPFYDLYKKTFQVQMQKYKNQGQKDAALAKAYSQAILDLAPFISTMSKMFSKNPALKKYHQRIAKIDPMDFASSTRKPKTSKGKAQKGKKKQSSTQALTTKEIIKLAKAYNKGGARGKYTKFKAQYGVRNADKIKAQAAALRQKGTTQQSKPKRKRRSTGTAVATRKSSTITYQRKKDKNGRFVHYKVAKNGKKTRISKADYQKKKK